MMTDEGRWLDPEELAENARPSLGRAMKAIEAGQPERATRYGLATEDGRG